MLSAGESSTCPLDTPAALHLDPVKNALLSPTEHFLKGLLSAVFA